MKYRLKKGVEAFEVVDGPMTGRKFEKGKEYKEIPAQERRKFEAVTPKRGKKETGKQQEEEAAGSRLTVDG